MIFQIWAIVALALLPKTEFHQGVDYTIEARLNDTTHVLTGRALLRYTNQAPEAIDTLWFHLHLNAFRPNSAWATRELQFNNRRFQDQADSAYAYDRVSAVHVDGRAVKPVYPFAPDSTVMAVPLPQKLASKATATVRLDWTSRLSTTPRRQGRAGRHYDFAHWYPRIAVYDTAGWHMQQLLPQGEFFGEFASYDVTLDVPADEVIGATGVPVSGDPGWERANADKTKTPVYQRDAYAPRNATALGLLGNTTAHGRKRVRWRAEQVHHFAWAADPAFVYEGDQWRNVALHSLYLPGDSMWPGRAIAQTKQVLEFFDTVVGPYVYPQLTALRRLDGGGTEFPMLTMNEGPRPPIVHEVIHQWFHAIFGNNETVEGWLDEGIDSYVNTMFTEAQGRAVNFAGQYAAVVRLDSLGRSEIVSKKASDYRDFNSYQIYTYLKPVPVLRMLRWYIGDADFRRALKLYYQENKLEHVDENDFKTAMESISGKDLDWFFDQWLHTTKTLDYTITEASSTQQPNGSWQTRVVIQRTGEAWMPVELKVGDQLQRIDTHDATYTAFVTTPTKPAEAVLDPDGILLDQKPANNRRLIP